MIVETLSQLFELNTTKFNKPDLLIYRGKDGAFHRISSNEFRDRVIHFALGLKGLGVKQETKVLLLSENRPEWHIVDFACHLLAAVVVPIFPTLIADQVEYILNHSGAEVVVVSTRRQLEKILSVREKIKKVKHIIVFEADAARDDVHCFENILQAGREQDDTGFYDEAVRLAKAEEVATIIYTSGTTGVPKGVMLSHRNIVSNFLDCSMVLRLTSADRALSFLPLSHAFERTVDYVYFYRGLTIAYCASLESLAEDLREASPVIMANVPRFYEKVKSKIEVKAAAGGGLKKKIFDWALAVGKRKSRLELQSKKSGWLLALQYSLAEKLVFRKIRAGMGGNIRFFISGGAPLSAEVGQFFLATGLKILEGYGLTETAPVISVNPYDRPRFGTVGKLMKQVEVRIADDGEILVKGPSVMVGYYKMPEETESVIADGWFHTGDIGVLDEEGYLKITDRIKQLLVTSVGKKVAPQPIEKEVENSLFIEQVLLIGEKRSFISALIVPDFEQLEHLANDLKLNGATPDTLLQQQPVYDLIQQEIDKRQAKFSDYEKIRKFKLLSHPFTIENGELTPTMKIKRRVVVEKYSDLIEEMYAN
ncbi:MAG: AMP-dependent synthetase/ligase [bacterium]